MNRNFFIIIAAVAVLCSCGHKSTEKEQSSVSSKTEEQAITRFNNMSDNQYRQTLLEVISNGDKELFAKMVSYPIHRIYPLPDIENPQQMVQYFDTMFDKSFREQIAGLDSNSWIHFRGNGWTICNGAIWDTSGCIVISHTSPIERRYAQYLIDKDRSRLHHSMLDEWEPYDCFFIDSSDDTTFKYSYARLDVSTNHFTGVPPIYRIAMYTKESQPSDAPDLVLFGTAKNYDRGYMDFSFILDTVYICIIHNTQTDEYSEWSIMTADTRETEPDHLLHCKPHYIP